MGDILFVQTADGGSDPLNRTKPFANRLRAKPPFQVLSLHPFEFDYRPATRPIMVREEAGQVR
jgi:hypothetical protein